MTEGLAFEPPDEPGWVITDPDGRVVDSGGPSEASASADGEP